MVLSLVLLHGLLAHLSVEVGFILGVTHGCPVLPGQIETFLGTHAARDYVDLMLIHFPADFGKNGSAKAGTAAYSRKRSVAMFYIAGLN